MGSYKRNSNNRLCSMQSRWRGLIPLLLLPLISCQIPRYFSGPGNFTNKCPTLECARCGVGYFRQACANVSTGYCAECTGLPQNANWTTDGWFNNSCNFTCYDGFVRSPGPWCSQIIKRYTVNFQVSITLAIALNSTTEATFNMTEYITAVASQAKCGACSNFSFSPVACGVCQIAYNYSSPVRIVYRRLLAGTNRIDVDTKITVDNNQALADAAATSITTTTLSSKITSSASLTVTTAPKVAVQTIVVPPPAPPPAPPPVPPPPPPATPAPSSESSSGTNVGVIAGAVSGVVVLLVGLAVCVCCLTTRRSTSKASEALPNIPSAGKTPAQAPMFKTRPHSALSSVRLSMPGDFQRQHTPPHTVLVMGRMNSPQIRPAFLAR